MTSEGRSDVTTLTERGWQVVRLASDHVEVDVLPEKGGDVLAVRWRPLGINVLWQSPWGLRAKGSAGTGADSFVSFLEHYPGGWQTIFPNGGTAAQYGGVELAYHGEATSASWSWERIGQPDETAIALTTELVRSPFRLRRELRLSGSTLEITERFRNVGGAEVEAMWSHHPAFGAPFLDSTCTVACGARQFLSDDEYDTPNGDLQAGAVTDWPLAQGKDGGKSDLQLVPGPDARVDRFGYLLDFEEPWYSISNAGLRLAVDVRWDASVFPHAWYWCEMHGSAGFPWFQRAYVLAIEPASSYPGRGLAAVLEAGGPVVKFAPGEERTAVVSMHVRALDA